MRIVFIIIALSFCFTSFAMAKEADSFGVKPIDKKNCPSSYPIKANIKYSKKAGKTKIYHLPEGWYYEVTKPVRCYASESAAISDGYRKAQRGNVRLKGLR